MFHKHLNEKLLGEWLILLFPNHKWINNKSVPNSGIRARPDYRNDELMILVEFDGYMHFSSTNTQFRDMKKEAVYSKMGYKIIKIPYFIQLTEATIFYYFGIRSELSSSYNHGFINEKAMIPSDFNLKGDMLYNKILNDLTFNGFPDVSNSIKKTEKERTNEIIKKIFK